MWLETSAGIIGDRFALTYKGNTTAFAASFHRDITRNGIGVRVTGLFRPAYRMQERGVLLASSVARIIQTRVAGVPSEAYVLGGGGIYYFLLHEPGLHAGAGLRFGGETRAVTAEWTTHSAMRQNLASIGLRMRLR
jgi:hypothetical protein